MKDISYKEQYVSYAQNNANIVQQKTTVINVLIAILCFKMELVQNVIFLVFPAFLTLTTVLLAKKNGANGQNNIF
jgi:hypothetical protein